MYFWLVISVVVVWAWLVGGIIYGYLKSAFGLLMALGSFGAASIAAAAALLIFGPYATVIYDVFLQPGCPLGGCG